MLSPSPCRPAHFLNSFSLQNVVSSQVWRDAQHPLHLDCLGPDTAGSHPHPTPAQEHPATHLAAANVPQPSSPRVLDTDVSRSVLMAGNVPGRAHPASPPGSETKRPALCKAGTWGRKGSLPHFSISLLTVISCTEAASRGEQSHQLPELNGQLCLFVPLHIILLSWWSLCKHILHSFAK